MIYLIQKTNIIKIYENKKNYKIIVWKNIIVTSSLFSLLCIFIFSH
jgi:hypothetical protein